MFWTLGLWALDFIFFTEDLIFKLQRVKCCLVSPQTYGSSKRKS